MGALANISQLLQTRLTDDVGMVTRPWWPFFTQGQPSNFLPAFVPISTPSNGTGDASLGINQAIQAAVSAGGGIVFLGPGTYNLLNPIVFNSTAPVTLMGAGRATVIQRGADMPQGIGVIDIQTGAANVTFESFLTDGMITQPTGILYSQLAAGDPVAPLLSNNSTFWVHDGASRIFWNNVVVTHTGGYSVIVNAFNQDITDLFFYRLQLENNRPHAFGFVANDLTYGSWTGGVLLHGNGNNGNTSMPRRVDFLSCSARRVTGNAFWAGHVYGFDSLMDGIRFTDIYGEDCGRDLIQLGATQGCRINGVTGRRIGYMTFNDNDAAVAKWLVDQWAVAIDCGPCWGTVINNVNLTSCNGGCLDIDGMNFTTVTNFSFRTPQPGDPEYNEDGIGLLGWAGSTVAGGPNAAYGILEAPAGYGPWFEGSHCVSGGNIVNMSAGAIRLYGAHNSTYRDIRIWHPPQNNGAPVQVGNLGPNNIDRSYGLTILGLHIEYNPVSPAPCISEVGGASPFQATDINYYLGNIPISTTGATAAAKDPNSGSVVSITDAVGAGVAFTVTDGFVTGHA